MEERLVSGDPQIEDISNESGIRPHSLTEYVVQDSVKENLGIALDAAKARQEVLDHVLLYTGDGSPLFCGLCLELFLWARFMILARWH